METTIDLLNRALQKHPQTYWTKEMGLARTSLSAAKARGHLSPAMAGLLAHLMGEDSVRWIVIAALEAETGGNGRGQVVSHLKKVAEAVRFELTEGSHLRRFSRPLD
jgi:hypothetical protein